MTLKQAMLTLLAALALVFPMGKTHAQSALGAQSANQDPARLTLHGGWAETDGTRFAGLRMELEPGWKTYWRSPGAMGIPPHFDWTGSENVADIEISWPAPSVFYTFGEQNIGYKDRLVMPFHVTPKDKSAPIRLQLSIFYGLCQDVCIPARDDMAIEIAPDGRKDGAVFIRNALALVPSRDVASHITSVTCVISGAGEDRQFEARITFADPLTTTPHVIPEGPDDVLFGRIVSDVKGREVIAAGYVRTSEGGWIDRNSVNLTLLNTGGPALHIDGCALAG